MTGKRLVSCVVLLAVMPVVQRTGSSSQAQTATPTPYHVYRHFFASVVHLKNKADELVRQGTTTTQLRSVYRDRASLSQTQADQLEAIAVQCASDIEQQDAKARAIIAASRALYPKGRLLVGEQLPSPPAELAELQKGKEEIVLRARERLRQSFGGQEFARLEQFVQANIASKIQVISLEQVVKASRSGLVSRSLARPKRDRVQ